MARPPDDGPDDDAPDDDPDEPPDDGDPDDGDPDEPADNVPPAVRSRLRAKNREAANLRRRLKELEPLAEKARKLEEAGKTELERATETTRAATERASKAEADAMRLRVAIRKGLTEKQAARLVGETEEELEEDAADLLGTFGGHNDRSSSNGGSPGGRPRERLRPGAVPEDDDDAGDDDPAALAARIRRSGL